MHGRYRIPVKRSVVMAAVMIGICGTFANGQEYHGEYEGGPELLGPDEHGGSKGVRVQHWVGCATRQSVRASPVGLSFRAAIRPAQHARRIDHPAGHDGRIGRRSSWRPPTASTRSTTSRPEHFSRLRAHVLSNAGATGGLNGDARILFDKTSQKWIALQFGAKRRGRSDRRVDDLECDGTLAVHQVHRLRSAAADYPMRSTRPGIGTNNFGGVAAGRTIAARRSMSFRGPTCSAPRRRPPTSTIRRLIRAEKRRLRDPGVNSSRDVGADHRGGRVFERRNSTTSQSGHAWCDGGSCDLPRWDYGATAWAPPAHTSTRLIGRIANAWEMNGRIYAVYTATEASVRWLVTDANTNAIIQRGRSRMIHSTTTRARSP